MRKLSEFSMEPLSKCNKNALINIMSQSSDGSFESQEESNESTVEGATENSPSCLEIIVIQHFSSFRFTKGMLVVLVYSFLRKVSEE